MKQPRFFEEISFEQGLEVELSDPVSNHVARVLRMKPGQEICLFNGKDQECLAELTEVKKRSVNVVIKEVNSCSRESFFSLTLVQALSKGDRFDLVVQKAVELGVTQLIPVITERNNVRLDEARGNKKIHQWQAIIQSASEQCGRNTLMKLSDIQTLEGYLADPLPASHFVLDPYSPRTFQQIDKPSQGAVFFIGPEGGFSSDEIVKLTNAGTTSVSFGPRILRTETAAIAVCGIAQMLWGDLGGT